MRSVDRRREGTLLSTLGALSCKSQQRRSDLIKAGESGGECAMREAAPNATEHLSEEGRGLIIGCGRVVVSMELCGMERLTAQLKCL